MSLGMSSKRTLKKLAQNVLGRHHIAHNATRRLCARRSARRAAECLYCLAARIRALCALQLLALSSIPLLSLAQQNKLVVMPGQQFAIRRGATATADLKVMTLPGFHVNSDKPRGEYLIPLQLSWTSGPVQAQGVKYPKPEEIKLGNETLSVFTGTFTIQTEFKAPATAAPGTTIMTGKLRYQACNNQMCFRPSSMDVRLPLLIE
jgi:DsbC/DsbD-like thiol-disulfide interchange protein